MTTIIFHHSKFNKQFVPAASSPSEDFLFELDPLDWLSDLNPATSLTVTNGVDIWLSVLVTASVISDKVTDETEGRLSPVFEMFVTITKQLLVDLLPSVNWLPEDLLASVDWLFVDSLASINWLEIDNASVVTAIWFDKLALMSSTICNCLSSAADVDGVNWLREEPDDWLGIDIVAPFCEADGSVSVVTDSTACSDLSSVDSVPWSAHTQEIP